MRNLLLLSPLLLFPLTSCSPELAEPDDLPVPAAVGSSDSPVAESSPAFSTLPILVIYRPAPLEPRPPPLRPPESVQPPRTGSHLRCHSVQSALPRHQIPPSAPSSGNSHKRPHERGFLPPSGAYAYGAGVVADTLLNFLKEAPCHDVLPHFNSGLATLTRTHPSFAWRS